MKKNLLKKGLLLGIVGASIIGAGSYAMSYRTMANEGADPVVCVSNEDTVTTKLYYYATMPGSAMDGSQNPVFGLGVQVVKAEHDANDLGTGSQLLDSYQFKAVSQEKALYPDIEYKGVTYKFAEKDSAEASQTGYYTLQLLNRTVEDGAVAGDNNYNTTADGHTYHVNYVIAFNQEVVQTPAVQTEEAAPATTSYTVNYLDAVTGEALAQSKTVTDQEIGATIYESAVAVDGYITPEGSYPMTLQEDASQNVMNFTYKKQEVITKTSYTVNYIDAVTGQALAPSKTVTDQEVGTTVSESAVKVDGYITPEGSYTMTLQEDATKNVMNLTYKKDIGQTATTTTQVATTNTTQTATEQYKYTVKYVDVDTNKEIATATTKTVDVNTVIKAENNRVTIKDYKYVKDTGDLTVTDKEGNNVMTVYYQADKTVDTASDSNMPLFAGLGAAGVLGAALLGVLAYKKKLAK